MQTHESSHPKSYPVWYRPAICDLTLGKGARWQEKAYGMFWRATGDAIGRPLGRSAQGCSTSSAN